MNKGDVLNCCGKMPSLRRAGLPGSFNLSKTIKSVLFAYLGRVGTVQSPLLPTNGGQLWRIDGSPVELNRSGRDLRRDRFREWKLKSQPIANPGNTAKDRRFQKQHREQGRAEQRQVDPEQHDQDEKPGRELRARRRARRTQDAGFPPPPPHDHRTHAQEDQAYGSDQPQELVGPTEELPFVDGDAGADDPVDEVTVLEIFAFLDRAGRAVHHEVHAPGTIRRHRLRGPITRTASGRFDDHGREQIERAESRDDPVDGGQVAWSNPAVPAPAPARSRVTVVVLTRRARRFGFGGRGLPVRPVLPRHGRAGQTSHVLEVVAPELRPGQAAEQQEKCQAGDPEAGNAVEIAPEHARASAKARIDNSAQRLCLPRPPQVEAGENHGDRPRRRQLHDRGTAITHKKLTVQAKEGTHESSVLIDRLENLQCFRMQIHTGRLSILTHDHPGGTTDILRHLVGVQCRTGNGREGGANLVGSAGGTVLDRKIVVMAVDPRLDLWFEKVDRPAACENDDERDAEQARIKMPSPDSPIVGPGFAITRLRRLDHGKPPESGLLWAVTRTRGRVRPRAREPGMRKTWPVRVHPPRSLRRPRSSRWRGTSAGSRCPS